MGPLVPDIFSNEFNLVIALLIGIGFGFILEQAGFSSTKKLVGLFYGYDFTVLKVFFTAGVTGMIGVLLLAHVDLLDLDAIYVNPTFLWSALLGGCIMGFGFVIGGFCPGTSICAAAVGKIDAMAFVLGSLIGVFSFTEGYSLIEEIYLAENRGAVRFDEFLGISPELFAFLITLIAALAFYVSTRIENRINGMTAGFSRKQAAQYLIIGGIPFLVIAVLTFTPSRQEYIQHQIREARQQETCVFKEISADKLALELVNNNFSINLIDVRDKAKYDAYHIPLAINIPVDSMMDRRWNEYFTHEHSVNVFYADADTTAKKACLLARFLGESENYILRESTEEFRNLFFNIIPPSPDALKNEIKTYNFRTRTAADLLNLEDALRKFSLPVKKEIRKIQGGCS
ncbi:MAG: YeeE/YedE family protein [Candidatus Zixiibacteriota bacterium]|nr:MAG: YeeE/YedE family protein [candidate division Zixibacteria bacterium]